MTAARVLTAALAASGALLAGPASPVTATPSPSVQGSGVGFFPDDHPHFPGDRVQVQVSARDVPADQVGRFTVLHHNADGGLFAHLHGYVDCVQVTAGQAIATGTITEGSDAITPDGDPTGETLFLRIVDGDPNAADAFAIDVSFVSGGTFADCAASSAPPVQLAVEQGDFRVVG